jgi:hypothetical protein
VSNTIKTQYGSNGQAITVTLASLGSGSARESTPIDNRTDLFLDALVFLQLKTGSGSIGADPFAYIYAAGTVDDGTTWPDTLAGTDAAVSLNTIHQIRLLGNVFLGAASTTFKAGPFSVASVFGGVLPAKWSIVVENRCGVTLDATEGNHKKLYQGIYNQVV